MSESFVVELRVSCFGEKTSRHFMKNKPLFCGKRAVVLRKTSRRFVESRKWMRRHREEVKKKVGGDGIFMGEDGE